MELGLIHSAVTGDVGTRMKELGPTLVNVISCASCPPAAHFYGCSVYRMSNLVVANPKLWNS
jgi:hypothetical protein